MSDSESRGSEANCGANFEILRYSKLIKIFLSARVSEETVSDGGSAKASEEADQAVANRVVVAKEEPGFQLYYFL